MAAKRKKKSTTPLAVAHVLQAPESRMDLSAQIDRYRLAVLNLNSLAAMPSAARQMGGSLEMLTAVQEHVASAMSLAAHVAGVRFKGWLS